MRQEDKKLKLGTKRAGMEGELFGNLEGGFAIVNLARVAANPIVQAVHITLRQRSEVSTFGEEAPDETICGLIISSLGSAVEVSVIERRQT